MKTILIVEDEKIIPMDYQINLEKKGFPVIKTVDNGIEAIKTAVDLRPNIILMDINIRGERNGIEIAKEIYLHYNPVIIFISAFIDEFSRNFGFNWIFMRKPISSIDILRMVIKVDLGIMNPNCRVKESDFADLGECQSVENNTCEHLVEYGEKFLCIHENWKELLAIEKKILLP